MIGHNAIGGFVYCHCKAVVQEPELTAFSGSLVPSWVKMPYIPSIRLYTCRSITAILQRLMLLEQIAVRMIVYRLSADKLQLHQSE